MKTLVLLAAYNGEKYIKEQLQSILDQDLVEVDILVFDDGSSDSTISIVEEYSKKNKNIFLVKNLTPTGSAALNFLYNIRSLDSKFIEPYNFFALSDQDDIWLPKKLSRAIEKLLNIKTESLYASNLIIWDEKSNKKALLKKDFKQKKFDYLFEGGSAGCTYVLNKAFLKDLVMQLSKIGLDKWRFLSHDWLIYFIARINGYRVFLDNRSEILYRIHGDNVHGELNIINFHSVLKRMKLVRQGWYLEQIKGFNKLIKNNSKQSEIYKLYTKSRFSRIKVLLKYNFKLIRSKKKFCVFMFLSILSR